MPARSSRCARGARLLIPAAVIAAAAIATAESHDPSSGEAHPPPSEGHAGHVGEAHAAHDDATAHHRFEDAAQWAARFEDPERDAWQLPDRVVEALVDRPDLVIADVGSATGYFPVRFARAVPRGMVIGSDIEPGMVTYLNDRARAEGLENLVSVLAGPEDPHLPRTVDLVFFCDTIHHIDDRIVYLGRLKESLREGGRVAVVDFRPESPRGPPHKLPADQLQSEMRAAGYRLLEEHTFLPDQYLLVFTPQP